MCAGVVSRQTWGTLHCVPILYSDPGRWEERKDAGARAGLGNGRAVETADSSTRSLLERSAAASTPRDRRAPDSSPLGSIPA